MDDIFDEADEILSDDTLVEKDGEEEKNFNDAELQDIMSEIEDLEKEFEVPAAEMTLQEQIDAELAMGMEQVEVKPEIIKPAPAAVINFEKPVAKPVSAPQALTAPIANSGVSFAAQGQMSLNLDFKVGEDCAKLSIDPVKGLIVTLSGVELCINQDTGCTVSMENGMKFTIPLSSQVNSLTKKAA